MSRPLRLLVKNSASEVDAVGMLVTTAGELAVMRVNTTLTRTVSVVTSTFRYLHYLSECRGSVASIASQVNGTQAQFSFAAEAMRLTP